LDQNILDINSKCFNNYKKLIKIIKMEQNSQTKLLSIDELSFEIINDDNGI